MQTQNFQIKVPWAFPLTADYSQDWIKEQVKTSFPQTKEFEVSDIKVEYINGKAEKTITATCVLYQ